MDNQQFIQSESLLGSQMSETKDHQLEKDVLEMQTFAQIPQISQNHSIEGQTQNIEHINYQQEQQTLSSIDSDDIYQMSANSKIDYLNNFAKFNLNIFQQLDSMQNTAFFRWFTSLKFIFKNLLCHLNIQVFKKIHSQIVKFFKVRDSNDQQDPWFLEIYTRRIRKNPELIQYFRHLSTTLSQTYQKIRLYKLEINQKVPPSLFSKISQKQQYSYLQQLNEKLSANGQTILRYCIENRQFKKFFIKVNTINQRIKEYCSIQSYKKQQKIVEQHYNQNPQDFDINAFKFTPSQRTFHSSYKYTFFKQIYLNLITLITKQLLNYQKLLKYNISSIIKKYKPSIGQQNYKKFRKNINSYNIYKSFFRLYKDIRNSMKKQQFIQMLKQFLIMAIQKVKLFVMVMAIPYYTFGNDLSKYFDMELSDQTEIFMKLDDLYIYKGEKISSELLRKEKQFKKLLKFFNQYINKCMKIINYSCLKQHQKKTFLHRPTTGSILSLSLHQQNLCIFDSQQRFDFLYNIGYVCRKYQYFDASQNPYFDKKQNKITYKFIKFIKRLQKVTKKLLESDTFLI